MRFTSGETDRNHIRFSTVVDKRKEFRPGTLNVAGIVGLGAACELAKNYMDTGKSCVATLRDSLHQKLNARLEDIHLNGHPEQRLPGNLNLCFAGVQSHALLMGLKSVAVSTGSACDSESVKASHVLVAMAVSE